MTCTATATFEGKPIAFESYEPGREGLPQLNLNNPGRNDVLATGGDLFKVLDAGYAAHQRLVINDGNPDAHSSPIGSRARTRKPPSGRGPASNVPPSKVARSLIPTMP